MSEEKTTSDRSDTNAKPNESDALADDISRDFYAALGKAIAIWSAVETGLQSIVQACLRKAEVEVVSAIYYSVDNFRARAPMADAALRLVLKDHPLLPAWNGKGGLHKRLLAKAKTRNALAHGMVRHWATENGELKSTSVVPCSTPTRRDTISINQHTVIFSITSSMRTANLGTCGVTSTTFGKSSTSL
jgi:hypothetical protein